MESKRNRPKVAVMMATFNGARFLEQQLISVIEQRNVDVHLIVADDGSQDDSVSVLNRFISKGHKISFHSFVNLGVPQIFFRLIRLIEFDFDYYAFCDQDDVWLPNHLENQIDFMEKNRLSLACSLRLNVDENLQNLKNPSGSKLWRLNFRNAVVENVVFGNTIVFDNNFRRIQDKFNNSSAVMHDSWFYLIGAFYEVIGINLSVSVLYRIHDNNATGISNRNVFSIVRQQRKFYYQFVSFVRQLDQLEIDKSVYRHFIKAHLVFNESGRFLDKVVHAFSGNFAFRQNRFQTFLVRLIFMSNLIK